MEHHLPSLAVTFVDICGSTALFETYGDVRAHGIVTRTLEHIGEAVRQHGGAVIQTIGDEVFCTFADADSAVRMCFGLRDRIATDRELFQYGICTRIGIHFGHVLIKEHDVFGDTVNLAARMTGLAKAEQIITTGDTVEQLSPSFKSRTRRLRRMRVAGKQQEIEVFQILRDEDTSELTVMPKSVELRALSMKLILRYGDETLDLGPQSRPVLLGRGESCQLMVDRACVSRRHATIEARNGKFVLTDFSTNGTYLYLGTDGCDHVHREEFVLQGEGALSLGRDARDDGADMIRFSVDA
jgi:class 3 adenylate cyclase